MSRALLVLSIVLIGLLVWDRGLESRGAQPDRGGAGIERLITKERLAGRSLAAVSVEKPGGDSLLYVRSKGRWRCREAFGAVADAEAVKALIESLVEARGVALTEDSTQEHALGLDADKRSTIGLHGPKVLDKTDRDLYFAFEVGAVFDEGLHGRALVREKGSARVLEIDHDPLRSIGSTSDGIPPLIDTHLLAASTGSGFRGFKQFFIDLADTTGRTGFTGGASLILKSAPGKDPAAGPDWSLEHDGQIDPCPAWRAGGYTSLFIRARCIGLARPARAKDLGLDPPAARLTLVPNEGDPIQIDVSALNPAHEVWVWNRLTNVVMQVTPEVRAMMVPDAAMFLDESRPNPWEEWLRK